MGTQNDTLLTIGHGYLLVFIAHGLVFGLLKPNFRIFLSVNRINFRKNFSYDSVETDQVKGEKVDPRGSTGSSGIQRDPGGFTMIHRIQWDPEGSTRS